MIDPTFATALLIIASSGVLIVVIFTVLYIRLNRKFLLLAEENDKLKKGPAEEAAKIIDASRTEAKRILDSAQQQSQKVISDSQFFSKDLTQHIRSATDQAITEGDKVYKSILEDVKNLGKEKIAEASTKLTAESISELTDLKNRLAKEFETDHEALKKQLELYKAQQMQEIAKKSEAIFDQVILKALGHGLTTENHKELIKKALLEIAHEYE